MIFILAEKQPALFVCLTSEDEVKLRQGLTLYVEPKMTGNRFFNQVILSLHRTKEDIVKMIRSVQPDAKIPDHLPEPPAREGEVKCKACSGSNRPEALFEDCCIVCWASEAKRRRVASN